MTIIINNKRTFQKLLDHLSLLQPTEIKLTENKRINSFFGLRNNDNDNDNDNNDMNNKK